MDKNHFLENIAQRLGRSLGQPPHIRKEMAGVPEFWAERSLTPRECLEKWIENFTSQGGEAKRFDSKQDLTESLDCLLTELSVQSVGAWGKTAAWPIDIENILDKWKALRWDETWPEKFSHVQVGITGCSWAIADTGTLVMKSGKAEGRGTHLMPQVHIVILRSRQICLRLGEVFSALQQEAMLPAAVHFISGPSRSSDIENDLSIGVHGPARVIAFILQED
ncbi:LutC/YkgG family protein [Alicyclobacillus tolerans]|uniref:LutC/YkgG family protein n=1 Tax=Alicyclobacillus tolerans TaxID=90970 RepID=UPI003B785AA1